MTRFFHRLLVLVTAFALMIGVASAADGDQPTTRDIINSFLSELLEFTKGTGAFVKEQLPLVLQEYVRWGSAEVLRWKSIEP